MSVLIKGLHMPDCCWNCPCADGECGSCNISGKSIINDKGRLADCPLIELPDHGDLIEKDPLLKKAEELEEQARAELERYKLGETNWEQTEKAKWRIARLERIGFKHNIADAPVVIPAERE